MSFLVLALLAACSSSTPEAPQVPSSIEPVEQGTEPLDPEVMATLDRCEKEDPTGFCYELEYAENQDMMAEERERFWGDLCHRSQRWSACQHAALAAYHLDQFDRALEWSSPRCTDTDARGCLVTVFVLEEQQADIGQVAERWSRGCPINMRMCKPYDPRRYERARIRAEEDRRRAERERQRQAEMPPPPPPKPPPSVDDPRVQAALDKCETDWAGCDILGYEQGIRPRTERMMRFWEDLCERSGRWPACEQAAFTAVLIDHFDRAREWAEPHCTDTDATGCIVLVWVLEAQDEPIEQISKAWTRTCSRKPQYCTPYDPERGKSTRKWLQRERDRRDPNRPDWAPPPPPPPPPPK